MEAAEGTGRRGAKVEGDVVPSGAVTVVGKVGQASEGVIEIVKAVGIAGGKVDADDDVATPEAMSLGCEERRSWMGCPNVEGCPFVEEGLFPGLPSDTEDTND